MCYYIAYQFLICSVLLDSKIKKRTKKNSPILFRKRYQIRKFRVCDRYIEFIVFIKFLCVFFTFKLCWELPIEWRWVSFFISYGFRHELVRKGSTSAKFKTIKLSYFPSNFHAYCYSQNIHLYNLSYNQYRRYWIFLSNYFTLIDWYESNIKFIVPLDINYCPCYYLHTTSQ